MLTTREITRQLNSLFVPPKPPPDDPIPSSSQPSFPSLSLPVETIELIDAHVAQFAASFPLGGGGGQHRDSEGARVRTKWRELLLDLWTQIEPPPGSEVEPHAIAKVSAFLELLGRLSYEVGDDDDCAIVPRTEIGSVWWQAVLKRVMLGTPRETEEVIRSTATSLRGGAARSIAASHKNLTPTTSAGTLRPLVVSRLALEGVIKMISWGMARPDEDQSNLNLTVFGVNVWEEHKERATALLVGMDEGYGVRNLEECILGWADQSPQAFFAHIEPLLATPGPARLSFLSLLLSFLTRHSGKFYHAKPSLFNTLITVALTSVSPAIVTQAQKSLSIFLVSLPVVIGEQVLAGIMAVYGRVVSWEKPEEHDSVPHFAEKDASNDPADLKEEAFVGPPPDALLLFTVLYGVYPCNFTAFLHDAIGYLKGKNWSPAPVVGEIPLISRLVKEKSLPYVRLHTLHPALFTSDATAELTDTSRWRLTEPADVRAECDRNLVQVAESRDTRGGVVMQDWTTEVIPEGETIEEHAGRSRSTRPIYKPTEEQHGTITPKNTSTSRSRSRTPLLPNTTHFTNFQLLQQQQAQASSTPRRSGSPLAGRPFDPLALSDEDFRRTALGLPSVLENRVIASSASSSRSASRRSSVVGASTLFDPREAHQNTTTSAQVTRLETEVMLLQGEVNFQTYLKQLHLAHMGTLHREKVLDSGAEAERQSLYRTIRTLRAQLKQLQSALDQTRSESGVTKANWASHMDDLREKLKALREQRSKWDEEGRQLRAQVVEAKDLLSKQGKELEEQGAAYLDLKNQVTLDTAKLARVAEYETRIEALSKTLAVCDEDLCKFAEQRNDMEKLVGLWKRSEMLRESVEKEVLDMKTRLRSSEAELVKEREKSRALPLTPTTPLPTKDALGALRNEVERLRARNTELEEAATEHQ